MERPARADPRRRPATARRHHGTDSGGEGRHRIDEFMMVETQAQAPRRKVAVLGPIPRDQIITHTGDEFEKYGCALYTAVALSALLRPFDSIVPISHVRQQDEG